MATYTGDTKGDLNAADPTGSDPIAEGDDAIRQIKRFLLNDGADGLLGLIYGVGHIWTSTTDDDPATTLGFGTWVKLEEVVLVAHKAASAEFGTVTADQAGSDGGEKTHVLTEAELPEHSHNSGLSNYTDPHNTHVYDTADADVGGGSYNSDAASGLIQPVTGPAGEDAAHNNIQPYRTVYMWERTA